MEGILTALAPFGAVLVALIGLYASNRKAKKEQQSSLLEAGVSLSKDLLIELRIEMDRHKAELGRAEEEIAVLRKELRKERDQTSLLESKVETLITQLGIVKTVLEARGITDPLGMDPIE